MREAYTLIFLAAAVVGWHTPVNTIRVILKKYFKSTEKNPLLNGTGSISEDR